MATLVRAVHRHHVQLRSELSRLTRRVGSGRSKGAGHALHRFLVDVLVPHAKGEEAAFYPAVDPIIKAHGTATRTMSLDHERNVGLVAIIGRLVGRIDHVRGPRKVALEHQLSRAAIQLEGILLLHLDKEERDYLPLLDRFLSLRAQAAVLRGMHEG